MRGRQCYTRPAAPAGNDDGPMSCIATSTEPFWNGRRWDDTLMPVLSRA
jgi:hypothetical protein